MPPPKKRPAAPPVAPAKSALPAWWPDVALGGILALLAVYFLHVSWRKWPDPIIDFGRELYLPWRITQGAVLYRDLQHVYGPFSPYFNAFVFRLAGVSLTSLIFTNILIYAGILSLLYYILRQGWGRLAALACGAVFVSVFSFSHLVGIGNYNYITPYSHETTHSVLLILLLIWTLVSLLDVGRPWKFFCAGLLVGVSVLIKPETMLAAGAVSVGAILLAARDRFRTVRRPGCAAKFLLLLTGVLAPMLVTTVLFHVSLGFTWSDALKNVNSAWLNVFTLSQTMASPMQTAIMGTDNLRSNLLREAAAGTGAVGFAILAAWGSQYFARWGQASSMGWTIFLVGAAVLVAASVQWTEIGPAIPGMLLCAAVLEAWKMWRQRATTAVDLPAAARVLLWLAGAAFLFRMAFNPRIYHYGYFQAPLATLVGLATLLVTVPDFFRLQGFARNAYQAVLVALMLWGSGVVADRSAHILALQTLPVGTGPDQFLTFDPQIDPDGALVELAREYLATDTSAHSLLVLPEGVMLNYLTRLPSTVPNYLFDPGILAQGRLETLMNRLHAAPPDRIVLISRDLTEYGVNRFGDSPDHGAALLNFIQTNYEPVFQRGGDPLDIKQRGVIVYALRSDSPLAPHSH